MATLIQHNKAERPPNYTCENVAEEMLNGILCHYEPPDPRLIEEERKKQKRRGILRAPRMLRRKKKKQHEGPKSVRWSDTHEDEEEEDEAIVEAGTDEGPPVEISCSLMGTCVEAGIEAGCISPSAAGLNQKMTKKTKKGADDESDDGILAEKEEEAGSGSDSSGSKKKKGILKKKNVKEEVVFDDDGNPVYAKTGKKAAQPPPPPPPGQEKYIPDLSGVKVNSDEDDEAHLRELARSSREGPSKKYNRPRQSYEELDDQDNSLLEEEEAARMTRRYKIKKPAKNLARQASDDWETTSNASNTSSLFQRLWSRKDKRGRNKSPVEEMDPVEAVRSEDLPKKKTFLEAISPRRKKSDDDSDWDESLPIVAGPPKRQTVPAARGRTRDPREANRRQARDPSPGGLRPARSRSADAKDRRQSFDPSALPSARGRSKSPLHSRSRSFDESENGAYPYMHPAHPLRQDDKESFITASRDEKNYSGGVLYSNDLMERQSMITAHRRSFDGPSGDDAMERQSFITANRQGYQVPPARRPMPTIDDRAERQSYIGDHRRSFESPRHKPGRVSLPSRPATPQQMQTQVPARRGRSMSPASRSRSPARVPTSPYGFVQQNPVALGGMPTGTVRQAYVIPVQRTPQGYLVPQNQMMMPIPSPGRAYPTQPSPSKKMKYFQAQPQYGNIPIMPVIPQSLPQPKSVQTKPHAACMPFVCQDEGSRASNQAVEANPGFDPLSIHHPGNTPSGAPSPLTLPNQQSDPVTVHEARPVQVPSTPTQRPVLIKPVTPEPAQEELTWEERTRQAWERLRSGFTFESSNPVESQELDKAQENKPEQTPTSPAVQPSQTATQNAGQYQQYQPQPGAQLCPSTQPAMQHYYQPGQPMVYEPRQQPVGILRQPSYDRRVTFGEPQEYYIDEFGQSVSFDSMMHQKKRKVLRGSKVFGGFFRKVRSGVEKLGLPHKATNSTELTGGSGSWENGYFSDDPVENYDPREPRDFGAPVCASPSCLSAV